MSLQDIKDQQVPVRLLKNMLERDRLPNGLLFWGPGGVGKHLAAVETAKAINCTGARADACDACLPCRKIMRANHPDVREIRPVRRARVIDVEAIEMLNEFAALGTFESERRVFIIVDADRMNTSAQNHFLKTLEEPPGSCLFILVSDFPRVLLPTIRSRCQQVRFGTLQPQTVADILVRERDLPSDVARAMAALSQGRVSRALELTDSEKRDVVLEVVRELRSSGNPVSLAKEFAKHLSRKREQLADMADVEIREALGEEATREDKERLKAEHMANVDARCRRDMMDYLYLFEAWYRDATVFALTGDPERILNRDQLTELEQAEIDQDKLERKVGAIEKARVYLERFLNEERVFRDMFFVLAD